MIKKLEDCKKGDFVKIWCIGLMSWDKQVIEESLKQYTIDKNITLNQPMQVLRALLTGKTVSISVFEILSLLPKAEAISRLSVGTLNSR